MTTQELILRLAAMVLGAALAIAGGVLTTKNEDGFFIAWPMIIFGGVVLLAGLVGPELVL